VNKLTIKDELTEFLLYTAPDSKIKVEIIAHNETVWLPQKGIAELFAVQVPAISKHLKNIFESGELDEDSVISILETTAEDGKNYKVKYYNSPNGRVLKSDTTVAKNYLSENEIKVIEGEK
jgi:hypothetical protein